MASHAKEYDIEIHQAVREGKKEVITAYKKVLGQVKDKFIKKKVQGDLKIEVMRFKLTSCFLRRKNLRT